MRLVLLLALWTPAGCFLEPSRSAVGMPKAKCSYTNAYGMMMADCKGLNLRTVPPKLNSNIQVFDLTMNRIRELHNTSFTSYGYLRYLYLEDNSITYIEPGAFDPLTDLEVLDISMNSLHHIPEGLHLLPVLRTLILSNNNFGSIHFTEPLLSIEQLELSQCKLKEFPNLETLPRLLSLNISSNRLKTLNINHIASLCRLRNLDLRGNKQLFTNANTYCDCNLLQKWSYMRRIETKPDQLCLIAYKNLPKPFDNSSCHTNETAMTFQESQQVLKLCEVEVQEYGSGPIRIRSSVVWTLGAVGSCVILVMCILSVYFVRRRQRAFPDAVDHSDQQLTTKSRT